MRQGIYYTKSVCCEGTSVNLNITMSRTRLGLGADRNWTGTGCVADTDGHVLVTILSINVGRTIGHDEDWAGRVRVNITA